jgi:hypothetical protein
MFLLENTPKYLHITSSISKQLNNINGVPMDTGDEHGH